MIADGATEPDDTSSFLMECLMWNVPNDEFFHNTWIGCLRSCLLYLYSNTVDDKICDDWLEVSDLKWLFKEMPDKRAKAHKFVINCWNYVGLE